MSECVYSYLMGICIVAIIVYICYPYFINLLFRSALPQVRQL